MHGRLPIEELRILAEMRMSDDEDEEDPVQLKRLGNNAFRKSNFRLALKLYTRALKNLESDDAGNVELSRILLANRGQTYDRYGDDHSAVRDLELALSQKFTKPDSPKLQTAKCHYRLAKQFMVFVRFNEGKAHFRKFKDIIVALNIPMEAEEAQLGRDIEGALAAAARRGDDFERVQLLRAVDARGIIIRTANRPKFLAPPEARPPYSEAEPGLTFNTSNIPISLEADLRLVPLAYPVMINAPYFKSGPEQPDTENYRTHGTEPLPDDIPISFILDNLFKSIGMASSLGGASQEAMRPYIFSALDHDDPATSIVIVPTSKARLLVVPRSATTKQIIEGASWPRNDPLPFRDLRTKPRRADDPVDGIELNAELGGYLNLYVIPNVNLAEYVDYMDTAYNALI